MPDPPSRVLSNEPTHRPTERFWPYAELTEQPTDHELALLHPELREALFGGPVLPFSISIVFPEFEGDACTRAIALAQASDEYTRFSVDGVSRHRARFYPGRRPGDLRDLYTLVWSLPGGEVLVDDQPVPCARELWLPLVWLLIG